MFPIWEHSAYYILKQRGLERLKHTETKAIELPKNERQYEIDGKTFIVNPVFKEDSNESITSILIKLIKADS